MKVGDKVTVKPSVYWHGIDIGYEKGKIIGDKGHLIVELEKFNDNPVTLFRYEVELRSNTDSGDYYHKFIWKD